MLISSALGLENVNTMKHLPRVGLLMSFAVALGGCPIWGDSSSSSSYCSGSNCPNPGQQCSSDYDCPTNEYCSGSDGLCHTYPGNTGGGGSASTTTTGSMTTTTGTNTTSSTSTGQAPIYCGNPNDCMPGQTCAPDGTCHSGSCDKAGGCIYGYICDTTMSPPACKAENPAACGADSDCASAGTGYRCVNGICTAPSDQCFDGTQCSSGDVCADGKCTPSCANGSMCPTDYKCSTVNTCTVPAQACTITNDCGSATEVCVAGACVPRSPGNGSCGTGTVWVENGCIPDQHASFVCAIDGSQDACATGSICLHHSCYISCASPNQNACTVLPTFNQCKSVTTTSGAHSVCGSSSNLGSDCNPTEGVGCQAGHICVDGYCK